MASGRDNGNIPEIDRELERLQDLGILGKDFMSGIYRDFYGGNDDAGAGDAGSGTKGSADKEAGSAHGAAEGGTIGSAADRIEEEKQPDVAVPDQVPETEPPKAAEPEEDPMETLDKLIGLKTIKHDVRELTDFVRIQKMRKDDGLRSVPVSLHLVFTGNPGTGKTTVARILAKLYQQIGVLSKGQLVEVDRSGLVAGYVGQTAIKTQEQIQKALGGVLFIDEAYSLAQKDDAFGQEAIDTILKAMEDHRDEFIVVVAGYTDLMQKFLDSNPGLRSRFNKFINFPDYTVDELTQIFSFTAAKNGYKADNDALAWVKEYYHAKTARREANFANARDVRNLFEKAVTAQANRLADKKDASREDLETLTYADVSGGAEAEDKAEIQNTEK